MALNDLVKQTTALTQPLTGEAQAIKDKSADIDKYNAATKPADTLAPVDKTVYRSDKVNPKARYGSCAPEKRIDTSSMTKQLGSYEKGTSHVPKTGIYKLHEGEAVIPKDKNMANTKDKMVTSLSGDDKKKPKKEIKEMVHTKTHNGKHVVVHKHHHPEHHPDETHALEDMSALHQHMEDHAGTPNEGEGPESAPQGAPAPMTAAPSPTPDASAATPAPAPMAGQGA